MKFPKFGNWTRLTRPWFRKWRKKSPKAESSFSSGERCSDCQKKSGSIRSGKSDRISCTKFPHFPFRFKMTFTSRLINFTRDLFFTTEYIYANFKRFQKVIFSDMSYQGNKSWMVNEVRNKKIYLADQTDFIVLSRIISVLASYVCLDNLDFFWVWAPKIEQKLMAQMSDSERDKFPDIWRISSS